MVRPLLAWPFEGLLFDVEENGLWWTEWGDRPDKAEERADVLRDVLGRAPRLIPIFSHRYLPATRSHAGDPHSGLAKAQFRLKSRTMIKALKQWLGQWRCKHEFRYSRSKPGTLVCKRCRKRKSRPKG